MSALEGEISRLKMVILSQRSLLDSMRPKLDKMYVEGKKESPEYKALLKRADTVGMQVAGFALMLKTLGYRIDEDGVMRVVRPDPLDIDPADREMEMHPVDDPWAKDPPASASMRIPTEIEHKLAERHHVKDLKEKNYKEMGAAYEKEDTLLGDALKAKIVELDKKLLKLDREIERLVESPVKLPRPARPVRPGRAVHRFTFEELIGYSVPVYGVKCACTKGLLCEEWTVALGQRTLITQYYACFNTRSKPLNVMVPIFGQILEGIKDSTIKFPEAVDRYNDYSFKVTPWRSIEIATMPGAILFLPEVTDVSHLQIVQNQAQLIISTLPASVEAKIRSRPDKCISSNHNYGDTDKMTRLIATGDRESNAYKAMLYLRATRDTCLFCYTKEEPAFMGEHIPVV
jgi:hypothetical protein